MTIFATSDWHLSHKRIIEFSNRPFTNLEDMHWKMIKDFNRIVTPQDTTYFLGDISFATRFPDVENHISQLNGKKILIFGNHDKPHRNNYINSGLFEDCLDYFELNQVFDDSDEKILFVMSHYPFMSWNKGHHGSVMIHGHVHSANNALNTGTRRYDVGVDANNYQPISLKEVWDKVKNNLPIKHH